jgi:hypothetical protein
MIQRSLVILFGLLFMTCTETDAQSVEEGYVKEALAHHLRVIKSNDAFYPVRSKANNALDSFLQDAGKQYPQMITWNFEGLDTLGLKVLTSSDKKLRMYVWDQNHSDLTLVLRNGKVDTFIDQSKFYGTVVQYVNPSGEQTTEGRTQTGEANMYTAIRTINTASSKTVYLASSHFIDDIDSLDGAIKLESFVIKNGYRGLYNYDFFHGNGDSASSVSYYYNLKESAPLSFKKLPLITLSPDRTTLTVPLSSEEGRVSDDNLLYRFTGEKFVFEKKQRSKTRRSLSGNRFDGLQKRKEGGTLQLLPRSRVFR